MPTKTQLLFEKLKTGGVKDIQLSVIFKNLGQSLYATFEPIIFFLMLNKRIELVLLYYGIQSLLFATTVSFGTHVMTKLGVKKNMIIGTVLMIIYRIILIIASNEDINLSDHPTQTLVTFTVLGTILAAYQTLYWPGFHTNLSLFMKKKSSGKEVAIFKVIGQISSILGPAIGGIILFNQGTVVLVICSAILLSISAIPLFFGPDIKNEVSLSFRQFASETFKKKNFRLYLPFHAEGVLGYINAIFWNLFIFINLKNVLDVGFLSSGVSLFTAIVLIVLGWGIDNRRKIGRHVLTIGTVTNAIGWLLKGIPSSGVSFFIVDNIQKFGNSIVRIPYEKNMYSRFRNRKDFADEYVTLREIAYHTSGGIIMILLAILMATTDLLYTAFIVAAISSLTYLLMRESKEEKSNDHKESSIQNSKF